jgi:hypothetical protein
MEHGVQNKRIGVDDLNRHLRFESEQTEVMMPLDALIHAGFSMVEQSKAAEVERKTERCWRKLLQSEAIGSSLVPWQGKSGQSTFISWRILSFRFDDSTWDIH